MNRQLNSRVNSQHPLYKCDHEENRTKVCALCGKKIIFQNKPSHLFLLSEKHIEVIKKHINNEFNIYDIKFPKSLCSSCRLTVNEYGNDIFKRPRPTMPNYEDLKLSKETRTMGCNCYICLTARVTSHKKQQKGRGLIRDFSTNIDVNKCFDDNSQQKDLLSKNEAKATTPRTSTELCNSCFQQIGKGISHSCRGPSTSNARENVLIIVQKLPEKQQNQIITKLLKKKISNNANDNKDEDELELNTLGSKVRVIVNKKKEKELRFSAERLDNFQANTGSSTNDMKKLANFIRSSAGRKSVPKNYNQHLYEKSNVMEHIYKEGFYEFETSKEGIKKRPVVYAIASELVDFVFENRNIEHIEQSKIKVMADGGQDFFKISLSISIPEDDLKENDLDKNEKVSTYATGGSMANKRKLTSVFKLLLLGIVPRIKETYDNFKILVELTKLNEIPFKFVGDLKLVLLVNGQQTATSFYPCPYCFVTLNELKSYDKIIEENDISSDDKNLDLKTYKHLKDDYLKFKSLGNDKKKSKECRSTVHHPLFIEDGTTEDDNMYVLQKCIPPELHLLQGFVNHLFWDGIVKIEEIGKDRALLWPNKLGISHKSYQGDIFEGNQCRKLLKAADELQDPEIYELVGPFRLQPYIAAFKAMNKIVEKCFAAKKADLTDFNKNLKELREALKSTDISQTLKIHIILEHLEEAIIFLNNDGLGLWSEQAGESVHREFNKYWDRFKINLLDEPSFISRLKKAVVTFSSQHI